MDATNYANESEIPAFRPADAAPIFAPAPAPPPDRSTRTRRRWLATGATVLALAVVGVGASTLPFGAPLWRTSGIANAQADPQVAAIQQVIQRANDEQAKAIAAGDPSLMSDTATAAHYQELVKINQDLVSSGVTSISLSKLEWGPISVNGATATATTYETWITTTSDGTTTQSRDTNVYTLVQSGDTWTVQADDQPGQPTASGPGATAPQAVTPVSQNTSHNWSGYAATGHNYTSVTGTWTVPEPTATGAPGVGATWVGIGGVNSRDLIQAGTQDVANGSGATQYQAWIEMLPQASQQVPLVVKPGDSVTVSIDKQATGSNMWQISFTNNTTGQAYQKSVRYASSQSSADWVEEAPSGRNGILPLDNFGSIAFSNASTTQAGNTLNLTQAGAQPISLIGANGQALAVPSAIGDDGASFSVARTETPVTTATPGRGNRVAPLPYQVVPVYPFN
ncbi:MAG TPA: G1 family glutamic endopeptidase [Chloroflexota bacterium]|nr:G1 family glutamic endopeptidase [Chloroflexota bacterium]